MMGLILAVCLWDPIYCPINMILFSPLCGVVLVGEGDLADTEQKDD